MANPDSFLEAGDFDLMPSFSAQDRRNPNIIENQFTDSRKHIYRNLRRKTVYIPRPGKWLMASILATDPINNTVEDIALLNQARDTVFASFKKASPEYTPEQWRKVMELDPLYRPDTYVIIIQDPHTRDVVANLKLVYDHPDFPLPAEVRFPGQIQRTAPVQADVNLFNLIQGKIQKYTNGPVGGAIQVMEMFGPGYTSELVFLANFVLAEHRTVKYKHNGIVHEAYPKEIIAYGIESEMGGFHSKIGLKQIAKDGDYLMHAMPVADFQNAYRKSFVFRPGSKKLHQSGMVYQAGSWESYFFVRSIFDSYPKEDVAENKDIIAMKLKKLENTKSDTVVKNFADYYGWAVKSHNSCIEFYE